MSKKFLIITIFILLWGCTTSPVLQELNTFKPDMSITLREVLKNPEKYRGKMVLWGGRILKVTNKKEGTIIEILQLPLDEYGRPKNTDRSEGRFMVFVPEYLDPAIFREGRDITVVGNIVGTKSGKIGEVQYDYPFVQARDYHLWDVRPKRLDVYHRWPPYLYWGPYRSCGPYWWGWACW